MLCSILEKGSELQQEFILEQVKMNASSMGFDRDGSKLLENCIKLEINTESKNEKLAKNNLMTLEEYWKRPTKH